MISFNNPIGYIEFDDHKEDILKMKRANGATNVYEVTTNEGFYIHDCSKQDCSGGELFKQDVNGSQLNMCEFKDFVLFRRNVN